MGLRRFDRKFGVDLLRSLPEGPAVYLFKDEAGAVLYVGKAKNARRRLAQYRNASRRKIHRKLRELVRVAHALEVQPMPSESEALLCENALIREHRPAYNVDGAYDFLYPAIGTGGNGRQTWLCIASQLAPPAPLGLTWHGCFRPRWRAREAFDALVALCGRIGHLEPRSRWPDVVPARGTRFVAVRRLPQAALHHVRTFLDGESDALLTWLFDALLERPGARLDASTVHADLQILRAFYQDDARRLHQARHLAGWPESFVSQAERDPLFIRARLAAPALDEGARGS